MKSRYIVINMIIVIAILLYLWFFTLLGTDIRVSGSCPWTDIYDAKTAIKIWECNGWYKKDYCYVNLALETRSYCICGRIGKSSVRNYCYELVANISGDLSTCSKMSDASGGCYSLMASSSKNESICDLISTSDPSYDPGLARGWCYLKVAKAKEDPSLCDRIKHEWAKGQCTGNFNSTT